MTSPARSSRPELAQLRLPGPPDPWEAAGFTAVHGFTHLGGTPALFGADRLTLGLDGLPPGADVDGLAFERADDVAVAAIELWHANRVVGIDHVVALTDDFARTRDKLVAAGFDHRRDRDAGGGTRQALFVLGPCLLELAGPAEGGPRLWGITFVAEDLDAAAPHVGQIKDAVQPGRRIATVRREAGLPIPVALMTPRN